MKHTIHLAEATHDHTWGKWPDTEDRDYSAILAARRVEHYTIEGVDVEIVVRALPLYLQYIRADNNPHVAPVFPRCNNLTSPPAGVIEAQRGLLREFAADGCTAIRWNSAMQCTPAVAELLPELFDLAILTFGDDCPGSSETKTFPVARYFDALIYAMFVWNYETGERADARYASLGVAYRRFLPSGMSGGIPEWLADNAFSLSAKLARMRAGALPIDLVWVGYIAAQHRAQILSKICAKRADSSLRTLFHGVDMPDGVLEPRWPTHPRGMGYPVGPLYNDALFGINVPVSSIFNCRLMDLWRMGVVQVVYDPNGELAAVGAEAGTHFVSFDGTAEHFYAALEELRGKPEACARIAEDAGAFCARFQAENGNLAAHTDVFRRFLPQLLVGRSRAPVAIAAVMEPITAPIAVPPPNPIAPRPGPRRSNKKRATKGRGKGQAERGRLRRGRL